MTKTADGLNRLYSRLRVWERIPLLMAANARGDEAESRRLFEASPMHTWQFKEHLLAEEALHVLTLIYIGEQLEAAASYFFALWKLDDETEFDPEDWLRISEANAYLFAANAEAWRRFCKELGIDHAALTAANHRGWFLRYCEEHMPANAPSADELLARLRQRDSEAAAVVTADDLFRSWRRLLMAMC